MNGCVSLQEYKIINASWRIDWPGNEKPIDQPICGFNNELCPKDDTHITSMVIAGTLALMLFCGTGTLRHNWPHHGGHCNASLIDFFFARLQW